MLTTLLKFLLVGIWLAASVLLGTAALVHQETLRIVSAVIAALPGALALATNVRGLSGPSDETKQRVRRILQSAVVDLAKKEIAGTEIVQISLHVWLVPPWYRFLFPYQLRRRVANRSTKQPWLRRLRISPTLVCMARYRVQPYDPSGLTFRKGIGLVGRCVAHNQAGVIHVVKLGTPAFKAALVDEKRWKAAHTTTTQNLSLEAGRSLAGLYSEAAALVIKDASGDALGCVTIEFSASSTLHLPQPNKKAAKDDLFLQQLRTTSDLVQTQLRHGDDS